MPTSNHTDSPRDRDSEKIESKRQILLLASTTFASLVHGAQVWFESLSAGVFSQIILTGAPCSCFLNTKGLYVSE